MGSINIFKQLFTFLKAMPLIKLSNINNFFLTKKLGLLGFKPGAANLLNIVQVVVKFVLI